MDQKQEIPKQVTGSTPVNPVKKPVVPKKPSVFDKYTKNPLFSLGIVGVVNLLGLMLLFVYIGKLSSVSLQLSDVKNRNLASGGGGVVSLQGDIASSKVKLDYLDLFLPDEEGLVSFIKSMDELKKAETITNFTFANNTTVKDKTKNEGFPVVIEFEGDKAKIDTSLRAIQDLPYLLRTVNFEVNKNNNTYRAKLGGFLYVNEKFGKN